MTSFDDVVSLLVSDRVKSSLTEQCLKYVLSVENNLPSDGQQWLEPQRLSEIVDEYVSYTNVSGTRASFIGQMPVSDVRHQSREHGKTVAEGKPGGFAPRSNYRDGGSNGAKGPSGHQTPAMNTFNRKCLICGSRYHLKAACDKVNEKGRWSAKPANATTVVYNSNRPGQYGTHSPGGQSEAEPHAHVPVNRVVLDRPTAVSVCTASVGTGRQSADASRPTTTATTGTTALVATKASSSRDEIPTLSQSPTCNDSNADFLDVGIESLVSLFDECEAPVNESDCNKVSVTNVQFDMDRFIADSNVSLHYVNLIVSDDDGM